MLINKLIKDAMKSRNKTHVMWLRNIKNVALDISKSDNQRSLTEKDVAVATKRALKKLDQCESDLKKVNGNTEEYTNAISEERQVISVLIEGSVLNESDTLEIVKAVMSEYDFKVFGPYMGKLKQHEKFDNIDGSLAKDLIIKALAEK